ncbi:unnamed protein product [Polarella glacialis]|uniref:J domain-containing protein n=1 Tax=Polarella glacialis TaxID=89957 RepID=A0A813E8V3_POLGL|nr:unnamed protein product [Polarella glacialis]CAE8644248.1 unnamed protein product [Polarella glacialis]
MAPQWCFEVLGLEPGSLAQPSEVRRAYLQRVRETHPDKGGSALEFQQVVRALELIAGGAPAADLLLGTSSQQGSRSWETSPQQQPQPSAKEAESKSSEKGEGPRRFSLDEISKLAAQVRQLYSEKARAEREEVTEKRAVTELRRFRAQRSASVARQQSESTRLDRALRSQRRSSLPAGVELCHPSATAVIGDEADADESPVSPGARKSPDNVPFAPPPRRSRFSGDCPSVSSPRACTSSDAMPASAKEAFRAKWMRGPQGQGALRARGPARRTIDAAEADLCRMQLAFQRSGDAGVQRVLSLMAREPQGTWR